METSSTVLKRLGESIPGLGKCISLAGNLVAVARKSDVDGWRYDANTVQVHQFIKNKWMPYGSPIQGGVHDLELSENGECLIVGNMNAHASSFRVLAYLVEKQDWKQLGSEQFLPTNATPDISGDSSSATVVAPVSISADCKTVAVGSPNTIVNGKKQAGMVRVYDWVDSDWRQRGNDLEMVGIADNDQFGIDISLSGDGTRVAVGAYESTHDFRYTGRAHVYEWDGEQWIQNGQTLEGVEPGDLFGIEIAISKDGTTVAVGAPYHMRSVSYAGQVRVYHLDERTSQWELMGSVIDGTYGGDDFGRNLDLSGNGDILCVAGIHRHTTCDAKGLVTMPYLRVFHFDDTFGGEWKVLYSKFTGDEDSSGSWDTACSLSSDGDVVAHVSDDKVTVYKMTGAPFGPLEQSLSDKI